MSIGGGVAATLLRGLSWFLFALAALMLLLILARLAGLQAMAVAATDVVGVGTCAALGFAARLLARRFESLS